MEVAGIFDLLTHDEQSFKPKEDVLAGKVSCRFAIRSMVL